MPSPGRPPTFDHAKQHSFLRLLAQGLSYRDAARQVGVSPSTVFEKKRSSPAFAAACDQSKSQAIPALLEHIHSASVRSWRASAWLLERLRPDLFGRRVALGFDPAVPRPPKSRPASVATEEMVVDFIDSLRLLPEAQAIAKAKLAELEDQQHAWNAARQAYAQEINRRGRPHDFIPGDYIPFPGCLPAVPTPPTSPHPPDQSDVPDSERLSNNSDNSPHGEAAQVEPVQQVPSTVDRDNAPITGL